MARIVRAQCRGLAVHRIAARCQLDVDRHAFRPGRASARVHPGLVHFDFDRLLRVRVRYHDFRRIVFLVAQRNSLFSIFHTVGRRQRVARNFLATDDLFFNCVLAYRQVVELLVAVFFDLCVCEAAALDDVSGFVLHCEGDSSFLIIVQVIRGQVTVFSERLRDLQAAEFFYNCINKSRRSCCCLFLCFTF